MNCMINVIFGKKCNVALLNLFFVLIENGGLYDIILLNKHGEAIHEF